jgi:Membrane protein involved in the export of O-antigen and teichoic acid
MSTTIRKQTITASIFIFSGFLVGAVNTYLFAKYFTTEQYGLTRVFFDFGQLITAFASFGVIPVIYKFYPYYKDNLKKHEIDVISWAIVIALIGFLMSVIAGWILEPLFIKKFSARSKLIVDFYYLMFPFGLGMLMFSLFEGLSWAVHKAVVANLLRETLLRIITTVIIVLYYIKLISYKEFIYFFSCIYFVILVVLVAYLAKTGQLSLSFHISRVTKKFWKKMLKMQSYLLGGTIIATIASTIDVFLVAGFQNLKGVAVLTLAQYIANLIQIPQRSIQSVSVSHLSEAWKNKNYKEIDRIYSRSCINLLIIALFIFGNIWLNVRQGINLLHLQSEYLNGLAVVLILGIARIIDAGTGVNNYVIGTSTFWSFDFSSGVVLLLFRIPLSWILIKHYGIIGSAFAELISLTVYNFIRFEFIRRKFNMQPFNQKALYSVLLTIGAYVIAYYLLNNINGWIGIICRSLLFTIVIIGGVFAMKLTPDAFQLFENLKQKLVKPKLYQ